MLLFLQDRILTAISPNKYIDKIIIRSLKQQSLVKNIPQNLSKNIIILVLSFRKSRKSVKRNVNKSQYKEPRNQSTE